MGAGVVDGTVEALHVFDDDGAGPRPPALFAGGSFTSVGFAPAFNIARWSGSVWTTLESGTNAAVFALTSFDPDGPGGPSPMRLYAGGSFTTAGMAAASRIAAWDGLAWSSLGAGVNGMVNTLAVFDADGSGPGAPALYVGGSFTTAGSSPALNLARWDGAQWHAVGAGADNQVITLTVLETDGVAAPLLAAGGWFQVIGGVPASRVALFDGSAWFALGQGLGGPFPVIGRAALRYDPDGPGGHSASSLQVGGFFRTAGGAPALGLASWDGSGWAPVGGGIGYPAEAKALALFDDDGEGPVSPRLFVGGGYLPLVGGPGSNIAAWNGSAWDALGGGSDGVVNAFAVFDADAEGPDAPGLFVGGGFRVMGGVSTSGLARWGCPQTPSTNCPDANRDGVVNFSDITSVLSNWGASYPGSLIPPGQGDADGSGLVSFADVTATLSGWGRVCP